MPDQRFFTNTGPITLSKLAELGQCTLSDDADGTIEIHGVAPIGQANDNDLTFLSNAKYINDLKNTKAKACIIHAKHLSKLPKTALALLSENPYASYAQIASALHTTNNNDGKISQHATIDSTAIIGENCTIAPGVVIDKHCHIGDHTVIGANSVIGQGVKIGSHCKISANITITHSLIGDHVILHSGVRIGQDGFGFATHQGVHIKVPQLGRVIIHDHVEIGANSCIDRGTGPDTIIGQGCKIDNLVQIAHNVELGKGCIIVAHVGISGSTKLGNYVVLGGQVGVAGHLTIGDMVNVAAQSGVMKNIDAKDIVGGSPAVPIKQFHRQTIAVQKLIKRKE